MVITQREQNIVFEIVTNQLLKHYITRNTEIEQIRTNNDEKLKTIIKIPTGYMIGNTFTEIKEKIIDYTRYNDCKIKHVGIERKEGRRIDGLGNTLDIYEIKI